MTNLSKGQTALLNAYIHQQDTEVARALFAAPFISDTDYSTMRTALLSWVTDSQTGNLTGKNEDDSTFTYSAIGSLPIPPR